MACHPDFIPATASFFDVEQPLFRRSKRVLGLMRSAAGGTEQLRSPRVPPNSGNSAAYKDDKRHSGVNDTRPSIQIL